MPVFKYCHIKFKQFSPYLNCPMTKIANTVSKLYKIHISHFPHFI